MPHTHGTVNEVTRGSKAHQRRLMMTLTLTGTVFVAEIVGAIITGSLALLVDAGHMLTDMSVLICVESPTAPAPGVGPGLRC